MKFFEDPFLIAEAGLNHNGSLKKAFQLIDKAKKSGASAIKFQTYKTEKRAKNNSPIFQILKKCELNFYDFEKLKKYSDKKKIIFFSTPFDKESVNFLNDIKVKLFKVSSFDIINNELINEIYKTKKPIIFSTGMASLNTILSLHKKTNYKKIDHCFLHCVSSYPNKVENSYLKNITFLKKKLLCPVGLSDHTNGIKTSIYSYILGANIIEKHFMTSEKDKCVDAPVSITPKKFLEMKKTIEEYKEILGKSKFGIRKEERFAKQFIRKKIY